MSNSLVKLSTISIPTFSEANDLLVKGNKGMQDSITGFADILKGIQTEARNRNDAAIQNLINSAQTTEELRSPEFQQRMADLVGTFSNEYDAKAASAYQDGRVDTLDKRFINQQTMDSNQLNYEKNQLGYDQDQLNAAYLAANRQAAGLGYKTPEEAIKNGVNVDPISYNQYLQGNEKHDTDILSTKQSIEASKNQITMAQNRDKREQTEFDAEENQRKLNSNIASGQNQQLYADNPQVGNKYYKSQVEKMQSPAFLDSYQKYGDHVNAMSAKYGVPPELIWAVIGQESVGKVDATSPTGVRGIMQVTSDTFRDLGVGNDRTDPLQSIEAGTKYLGQLLAKYGGDYDKAIVAYNSGLGNVDKAVAKHGDKWLSGIRAEGQDYLPRIKAGITYARTGNTGSQFIDPTAKSSGSGSGSGGSKQIESAYQNSPQGIVDAYTKKDAEIKAKSFAPPSKDHGGGTYKNPTEWTIAMKDSGSDAMITNMLDTTRKSNFKFKDKEAEKQYNPNGVTGWDKLSDAQRAGALERAYEFITSKNSPIFGSRTWNIGDKDIVQFQKAIQAETDALLKPSKDTYQRELDANTLGTISTLVQRHGYSPVEAAQTLGLKDQDLVRLNIAVPTVKKAEANLTSTAKAATPAKQQQSAAPKTADKALIAYVKKVKERGLDKDPAVRNSVEGRRAIKAGLL